MIRSVIRFLDACGDPASSVAMPVLSPGRCCSDTRGFRHSGLGCTDRKRPPRKARKRGRRIETNETTALNDPSFRRKAPQSSGHNLPRRHEIVRDLAMRRRDLTRQGVAQEPVGKTAVEADDISGRQSRKERRQPFCMGGKEGLSEGHVAVNQPDQTGRREFDPCAWGAARCPHRDLAFGQDRGRDRHAILTFRRAALRPGNLSAPCSEMNRQLALGQKNERRGMSLPVKRCRALVRRSHDTSGLKQRMLQGRFARGWAFSGHRARPGEPERCPGADRERPSWRISRVSADCMPRRRGRRR